MGKERGKYIVKKGITDKGEDYNIYVLNTREKITGYGIGFILGFAATHIMFGIIVFSSIVGAVTGFISVPLYQSYLLKKRRRAMLMQFRDMLDSLSNSFSSGKNTPDSFTDAYNDMLMTYGDKAPLVKEIAVILNGLQNNYTIEDLLKDMAIRCGIDDINSFSDTFAVCNRLGGNMKKIVSESRDIINDKIEVEMEIQTTIASSKNEINIMVFLPFVIIPMMKTLGQESLTANTPMNIVVKFVALGMFILAYVVGRKITDIKV